MARPPPPELSRREGDLERLSGLERALRSRAAMMASVRRFLSDQGSLEVETPSIVRSPGTDLNLDPIATGDRFLITSPEFHMKRLLGAGYGRIHQLCRCFRQGEVGAHHNPEFTMLEWYWPGAGYLELLDELEQMVAAVTRAVLGSTTLPGRDVDLAPPWQRITVNQAFERWAGWRPGPAPEPDRFFLDLVDKVEPRLGRGRPTVLLEYPASQAILSRLKPDDPEVALRFELYVDSIELANAFDELTDAEEQRRRFLEDNEARRRTGKDQLPIDDQLLAALESMPPSAGAALGLDRLAMLLNGAEHIDQVLAFPEPWL